MKKKHIYSFIALSAFMCAFTSCNDDDVTYDVVGNPDNFIYLKIDELAPNRVPQNTYAYSIWQTPIGPLVNSAPSDIQVYVRATKPSNKDITVNLALEPETTVEGFATFPANSGLGLALSNNTVTIPAGSTRSNSVSVNVNTAGANWAAFTQEAYILPIKVVSASEGVVSEQYNTAYIAVEVDVKEGMLNTTTSSLSGTSINKSGFTATYSVPATGAGGDCTSRLFDNNNNNYCYVIYNHADKVQEEVITTIDLGQVYSVKGVNYRYYGNYYSISKGKIETSTDGSTWVDQGTMDFPSNSNSRNFVFWAPFEFRYIRLTSNSFYGGTGEGQVLAEFTAYQ